MSNAESPQETRSERRRRRNREALIQAAYDVVSRKGIDATTVHDITEEADVGLGTAYNYFPSKDDLILAAIEQSMDRLARRIETVTDTFDDPAQVFAYGVRTLMDTATADQRWQWLMRRSEVIADAIYRCFGPYAMRDLLNAREAGRYRFDSAELTWRQATWSIVGTSLAVCENKLSTEDLTEAVVNLLCMAGMDRVGAWQVAGRPRPLLPPAPDLTPTPAGRPDPAR
ncbi:MAG: TetR/AcrR family transcriptional regulator [Rhodospirillaceae bacterium]|nr:TetR/AcrR family transcriptional regulator [Rhodospirillaceae bacterium]